ncbi:MAG: ImmA/IrrE family metallo-endopeptidase [Rhodospirillales bacterium]
MPWYAPDTTGRLAVRPVFARGEIEKLCTATVRQFLEDLYGRARFPLETEDLKKLIERDTSDFDEFSDLSAEGPDVEGFTDFFADRLPSVRIDSRLAENPRRERRLRMTLAHEYGHVLLHAPLWRNDHLPGISGRPTALSGLAMTPDSPAGDRPDRHDVDWMEWQANYAAGALLMPYHAVADLLNGCDFDAHQTAEEHDRVTIARVTRHFIVSWSAATVRLRQLGVLRHPRRLIRG